MVSLIALAAIAPTSGHIAEESVKLARTYKADEVQAYSLEVTMDEGAQHNTISSEIVFKVKKSTDDGAEISMSTRKFTMKEGDTDTGHELPEAMSSPFDKYGLPHVMSTSNESWVYIIASFAGLVPGKEVDMGKGFDLDWTSKDKNLTVKGKGNAKELVEVDGVKAVKIDYEVDVTPGNEGAGHVKCTTIVGQDGVSPISSEGTVDVGGGTIKFKVKRLKA